MQAVHPVPFERQGQVFWRSHRPCRSLLLIGFVSLLAFPSSFGAESVPVELIGMRSHRARAIVLPRARCYANTCARAIARGSTHPRATYHRVDNSWNFDRIKTTRYE